MFRAVCLAFVIGSIATATGALSSLADDRQSTSAPQRLDSLLGREVSTRPDGDEGRVVDVLVDQSGRIRAAVVEFGGFLGIGTRKIAVDWSAFRVENGAIVVDVTRDKLRAAKEYKPGAPTQAIQSAQD